MTSPDAREPGGSETFKALTSMRGYGVPHDHKAPVKGCFRCELNEDEPGGSGAGSTVEEWERLDGTRVVIVPKHDYYQLRAALEDAQKWEPLYNEAQQRVITYEAALAQSRAALEAARIERQRALDHQETLRLLWEQERSIVAQSRATEAELRAKVEATRETLKDFADPDHWSQNDDGHWVWYGYYPPFERPAVDLLGSLDAAEQPARAEGQ